MESCPAQRISRNLILEPAADVRWVKILKPNLTIYIVNAKVIAEADDFY